MLGLLQYSPGRSISMERTQLLGLPVLRVSLVSGGYWEKHRLSRAARLLKRQGVHTVLMPKDFDRWDIFARQGLTGVNVLPLYRAMADKLVLAELKRRGVEPQKACVILRGEQVDADLARTARALCPRVRSVAIQTQWGAQHLSRELYWEFGAVAATGERGDVTVCFGGERQEGELGLCTQPELLGLELQADGLTVPEELEWEPVLAALWQAGRLKAEQLYVTFK